MSRHNYFVILIPLLTFLDLTSADCVLHLGSTTRGNSFYPPHFIEKVNNIDRIIQPRSDGAQNKEQTLSIRLKVSQEVTVACEGAGNALPKTNNQFNAARCIGDDGDTIQIGGKNLTYKDLGCKIASKVSFKEKLSSSDRRVTVIQMGWQQQKNSFITQMTLWHDKTSMNTTLCHHLLQGGSSSSTTSTDSNKKRRRNEEEDVLTTELDRMKIRPNNKRPRIRRSLRNKRSDFRKDKYFSGLDITKIYAKNNQRAWFANGLGLGSTLASKYIPNQSGESYFARGHLAPDADFTDARMKSATYSYVNTAPQWQSFNNGNWRKLEFGVRRLAASRAYDLDIYTGTHGQLTLADSNNNQVAIYLAKYQKKNVVPVPKYFWKVVHDKVKGQAVAIIGINNPHLQTVSGADVFCPDVCNDVRWMDWDKSVPNAKRQTGESRFTIAKGYMFCCSVDKFRNQVKNFPNLGSRIDLLRAV